MVVGFLADGVSSRSSSGSDGSNICARRASAERAANILGVSAVSFGDLPDNSMDTLPLLHIAQEVDALFQRFKPTTVYTHFSGDLNIDHRLTHEAVLIASRPQPSSSVTTVLTFETASSTEWRSPSASAAFRPDWFVDIEETLSQKLEALGAYAEELRKWPHSRSLEAVEHLARWRGATVGRPAAEGFVLALHIR